MKMNEVDLVDFIYGLIGALGYSEVKRVLEGRFIISPKSYVSGDRGYITFYGIGTTTEEYKLEKGTRENEVSIRMYHDDPHSGKWLPHQTGDDFIKVEPWFIEKYLSPRQTDTEKEKL